MSNSTDAPAPARIGLGRIVALYHLLILFTPKSLTYSVPLFLKRQCDRTLCKERFDAEGRGRGKVGRVVALSLCTTAHPLYNGIANIFGASISEATMRSNPRPSWLI